LKNIQAITFDFWGTLFYNARTNSSRRTIVLQNAIQQAGLAFIPEEEILAAIKSTWSVWLHVWENEYRTSGASEWLDSMQELLGFQLPTNIRPRVLQELEDVVLDGNTLPIEGVVDLIPLLAKEYRLGIISDTWVSSGKTLSKLLEREGLLKHFTSLVFSDEINNSKPSAVLFKTALDDLSARPQQAVHVGDLSRTDVAGANQFGMWSIRFNGYQDDPPAEFGEANIILAGYSKMPAALELLESLTQT